MSDGICSRCLKRGHRASQCKRPIRWAPAILVGACLLGGCAEMNQVQQSLSIVDTFCSNKKRTWSVSDTPETIREARAWNAALDKRCK
jgi:hypothetical protein